VDRRLKKLHGTDGIQQKLIVSCRTGFAEGILMQQPRFAPADVSKLRRAVVCYSYDVRDHLTDEEYDRILENETSMLPYKFAGE
jgi:hypothetical protein